MIAHPGTAITTKKAQWTASLVVIFPVLTL